MSHEDALAESVAAGALDRAETGDIAGDRRRASIARYPLVFVAVATVAGAALGVTARAWMRWISVDPEFSWSGTLAIVAGFTVFAAAQGSAAAIRIRSPHQARTAAVRTASGLLSGGLFGAAGAVMLPTVVFGSLALWRTGLRPVVRALLGLLAVPSVVFVVIGIADDNGWSLATIAQLLVFASIYLVIIAATWPTVAPVDDGWRPSRLVVVIVVGFVVAFLGLALLLGGIQ